MKTVLRFLASKWVIQFVGVIALGVLIWFVGPLVAIAGTEPLASEWIRALTVAGIGIFWLLYRLLMQIRAGRKDRQLIAELASAPAKSVEEQAGEEEVEFLRKNFEEALQLLRETRAKGRRGSQFLYELPWYVIIGAPGSGKTTALINSGLQFPLAERFGKRPIKGVSGTRNCDWWFTDEAVLLDTAGRYTTQDSHQAVDATAWQGFLGLLRKHRARRPLNGVLVAMSMSDLLQQTEEERRLNANAVRLRLVEMYQQLGVRLPVYMLFTKCDLIAGFTDFFQDLSQEDRAQVFGETFPREGREAPQDPVGAFESAYDELLTRLHQRTYRRIFDERDLQRRMAILEFPEQLSLLKPGMTEFLQDAFGVTRYQTPILLRGIYFTSATQEGTPIDRVMGILAHAFHLNRESVPVFSGRGKSFFLTRLLREVIFPEAELAGLNAAVERRHRWMQVGACAGTGLLVLGMISLWTWSYSRNRQALARVEEQIDKYRGVIVAGSDWLSNLKALVPRMRALREAGQVFEEAGWSMHLGLYQGGKVQSGVDRVYESLLQKHLLPLIKLRLEQRIAGVEGEDLDVLYELLRIYLSLGEPGRIDDDSRTAAEDLLNIDWQRYFPTDPESAAELRIHVDRLLRLPPDRVALNSDLVSGARARLNQVPQLVQIYNHLKREELQDHSRDLRLGSVLGDGAQDVFVGSRGRNVKDLTVPGFFTARGYGERFLKDALKALREAFEHNWVLGNETTIDPLRLEVMRRDFEKLYLADYRDVWMGVLADIQLRRGQTINQTAVLLDELSKKDSPLRALFQTIEANTSLSRVSSSLAEELAAKLGIKPDSGKLDPRTKAALESAKNAAGVGDAAQQPVRDFERQFESINRLVRKSGDQPPPMDDLLQALKDLHSFALQVASGGGGQALQALKPGAGGGGAAVQAAKQIRDLPEPFRSSLGALASSVGSQTGEGAKSQLSAMLQSGVTVPCQAAFAGRYPFSRSSTQDASLLDFGKFFSANGVLDGFFQNNLKDLVDTSRMEWRQLPGESPSFRLSLATLAQFQNAASIRDAFFQGGGPLPRVQFDLKPLSLDESAASFSLGIEGQELRYQHGPEQIATFQWPGPTPDAGVSMVFRTLTGQELRVSKRGAWAFFRLLDDLPVAPTAGSDRFQVTFQIGGHRALYELQAGSVHNPFSLKALRQFRCPEGF